MEYKHLLLFSIEIIFFSLKHFFQVENRLDSVRDVIQSWEAVDTLKNDLRGIIRQKKEELKELEEQPSKLHEEAAGIEITKLQVNILNDTIKTVFLHFTRTISILFLSLQNFTILSVINELFIFISWLDNFVHYHLFIPRCCYHRFCLFPPYHCYKCHFNPHHCYWRHKEEN